MLYPLTLTGGRISAQTLHLFLTFSVPQLVQQVFTLSCFIVFSCSVTGADLPEIEIKIFRQEYLGALLIQRWSANVQFKGDFFFKIY